MIQFNYKNFSENAAKGSGSNIAGGVIGTGMTGLMGYGMIQSHKQMKSAEKEHQQGMAAMNQQTNALNKKLDQAEKSFAVPLLAGLGGTMGTVGTGLMAGGMVQSHVQGKKQEKMNEEQVAAQERQTQAIQRQNAVLQRMAEKGNNSPEKVANVVDRNFSSILSERRYGFNMSQVTTAAKDLWNAGKKAGMGKQVKSNLGFGVATGLAAYGAGKWISHDMKKSGIDIDNTGNLVQKQKSYTDPVVQQAGQSGGNQAKKGIMGRLGKLGTPAICAAFEAPKVIGYYNEKKALKDQISGTEPVTQKAYTEPHTIVFRRKSFNDPQQLQQPQQKSGLGKKLAIGAGALGTAALGFYGARKGVFGKKIQNKPLFVHPGQTLSGFANWMGSFGVTSTKNVQNTAQNLATGAKSSSMKKFGQWAQDHKTAANLVALAPGTALGMGAFGLAEKAVKKPTKAIDPDAYKYQETKDAAAK